MTHQNTKHQKHSRLESLFWGRWGKTNATSCKAWQHMLLIPAIRRQRQLDSWISVSLRPIWSTQWAPAQMELKRNPVSKNEVRKLKVDHGNVLSFLYNFRLFKVCIFKIKILSQDWLCASLFFHFETGSSCDPGTRFVERQPRSHWDPSACLLRAGNNP